MRQRKQRTVSMSVGEGFHEMMEKHRQAQQKKYRLSKLTMTDFTKNPNISIIFNQKQRRTNVKRKKR